jgi:hypothetical protein
MIGVYTHNSRMLEPPPELAELDDEVKDWKP